MNDYEKLVEISLPDFLAKWFRDLKSSIFKVEVTNKDDVASKITPKIDEVLGILEKLGSSTHKVEVTNNEKEDYSALLSSIAEVVKAVKSIPAPEKTEKVQVTNLSEIKIPEVNIPPFPKIPEVKIPEVKFPKLQKVEGDVSISNINAIVAGLQSVVDVINEMRLELPKAGSAVATSSVVATTRGSKRESASPLENTNPSLALSYTDGLLTTITKTIAGDDYVKTLSYTDGVLTGVSEWSAL